MQELKAVYPRGLSSDEIASRSGLSKYPVRSRVAELRAVELVEATPARVKNETGMSAKIWRASVKAMGAADE